MYRYLIDCLVRSSSSISTDSSCTGKSVISAVSAFCRTFWAKTKVYIHQYRGHSKRAVAARPPFERNKTNFLIKGLLFLAIKSIQHDPILQSHNIELTTLRNDLPPGPLWFCIRNGVRVSNSIWFWCRAKQIKIRRKFASISQETADMSVSIISVIHNNMS